MSGRSLELKSLRRELTAAQELLRQLEARIVLLEDFEFVDPLPGASAEAPLSSPGSGGVYLFRGPPASSVPGSGGVQLSQVTQPPQQLPHTPSCRPGLGGVDLSLAFDLAEDTCPPTAALEQIPEPLHLSSGHPLPARLGIF